MKKKTNDRRKIDGFITKTPKREVLLFRCGKKRNATCLAILPTGFE